MQIQTVTPVAELSPGHRAFYIRTSCEGHIVAATNDGRVSVVGPNRSLVSSLLLNEKLDAVCLHPNGHKLAVVLQDEVRLLSVEGNVLGTLGGPFVDAWFDRQANLWLASRTDDYDRFGVAIHRGGNLCVPHSHIVVDDPFGESALVFPGSPTEGPVPVWVAAGQDGQVVAWLESQDDELTVDTLDDFEECSPPEVSPSGDEFLLPTGLNELRRYDLLTMEQTGMLQCPKDSLITSCVYLDDTDALVTVEEGFVYRVNSRTMNITSEVEIEGHEPRKTFELYPALDDSDLCSDLVQVLTPGNDRLLSVHTILPDPEFRQHSRLAWWR